MNISIKRGVLTGLNDAFIIDKKLADKFINFDKKYAQIIRPLIRGRDVKRFNVSFPNLYLINIHNGIPSKGISPINIDEYPYIKLHMEKYYVDLKKRKDQGITPYHLRSCSYMDDFYKPKIIYPETTQHAHFYYDESGIFIDKTCFMMITDYPFYITSLLSSSLYEFAYKRLFSSIELGKNGYQYNKHALLQLPILPPCNMLEEKFKRINFNYDIVNKIVNELFNLNKEEIDYINNFINP